MSSILGRIEKVEKAKKAKKQPAQVKMEKEIHDEISQLLLERGQTWQDMLMAGVLNFRDECHAAKIKKAK